MRCHCSNGKYHMPLFGYSAANRTKSSERMSVRASESERIHIEITLHLFVFIFLFLVFPLCLPLAFRSTLDLPFCSLHVWVCINRPKYNRAIQNNKRWKENKIHVWHTHTHIFICSFSLFFDAPSLSLLLWLSCVRESLQKVILCSHSDGSSEQWITNKFPSPSRIVYL